MYVYIIIAALRKEVEERFPEVSLSCRENGLNSQASTLLKSLCDEFNNLEAIDKLANVQAKVDAVKGVMQHNIDIALKTNDR